MPLLTLIVFLPWIGAAIVALSPDRSSRVLSLAASLSTLLFGALALASSLEPGAPGMAFRTLSEFHPWIRGLNVSYLLTADALSLVLVLLTGIISPACLLASWNVDRSGRSFRALLLLLQGSALGVFLAQDFFLWFVFWELSLVPAFFLIRIWGGPGGSRAATQFFVYTIGGSAFLLFGFAAIYAAVGSANFFSLTGPALASGFSELGGTGRLFGMPWATLAFLGILLGFAVKAPLFPFHTWMPLTYSEAPAPVAMFLTAVMSKMGVYGFLRVLVPLFPTEVAAAAPALTALALGGVIAGAFAALVQRDLKRMLAYSSLNHVGYILLAIFAGLLPGAGSFSGSSGIVLQMFNHGLSAAALFFFVGLLEARSGGLRGMGDFGGVRSAAPILAGLCGIALFSSLGLPGLNGFVGEFLIFLSVFSSAPWIAALACLALLATAIFLLTFYQRVFHGPRGSTVSAGFADMTPREVLTVAPAIALMFLLGLWPQALLQLINFWSLPTP